MKCEPDPCGPAAGQQPVNRFVLLILSYASTAHTHNMVEMILIQGVFGDVSRNMVPLLHLKDKIQ